MLNAITEREIEDIIRLLEHWSQVRRSRGLGGETPEEIIADRERRALTDYLYALTPEARKELIALMLLGRGDFDHSYETALETCSKYTTADDQVVYLMAKTVRLAEYLRIGFEAAQRKNP